MVSFKGRDGDIGKELEEKGYSIQEGPFQETDEIGCINIELNKERLVKMTAMASAIVRLVDHGFGESKDATQALLLVCAITIESVYSTSEEPLPPFQAYRDIIKKIRNDTNYSK